MLTLKLTGLCTLPLAHVGTGQVMGWGEKAIEVRSVQTGQLDGVFMHKRVQAFTFLCERNEKVNISTKNSFVTQCFQPAVFTIE